MYQVILPVHFCPEMVLNLLSHHECSCRHSGDVLTWQQPVGFFNESHHQVHLSVEFRLFQAISHLYPPSPINSLVSHNSFSFASNRDLLSWISACQSIPIYPTIIFPRSEEYSIVLTILYTPACILCINIHNNVCHVYININSQKNAQRNWQLKCKISQLTF